MAAIFPQIYIARHGETEWSASGRHTGRTDVPLTAAGEQQARQLGQRLLGIAFQHIWYSPLQRATHTCELSGHGDRALADPDLMEWDYGDYEGLRRAEIHARQPGWRVFRDGSPNGESVAAVTARADRVIARLREVPGDILLYGHGHFSRALAARWLGLPVETGSYFELATAALSILGYEHHQDEPVLRLWNDHQHVR